VAVATDREYALFIGGLVPEANSGVVSPDSPPNHPVGLENRRPTGRGPGPIATGRRRDHPVICVVEQPVDLRSVERTHEYRGVYHVLGGALSPLDGVEPQHLRIHELFRGVVTQAPVPRQVVLSRR